MCVSVCVRVCVRVHAPARTPWNTSVTKPTILRMVCQRRVLTRWVRQLMKYRGHWTLNERFCIWMQNTFTQWAHAHVIHYFRAHPFQQGMKQTEKVLLKNPRAAILLCKSEQLKEEAHYLNANIGVILAIPGDRWCRSCVGDGSSYIVHTVVYAMQC